VTQSLVPSFETDEDHGGFRFDMRAFGRRGAHPSAPGAAAGRQKGGCAPTTRAVFVFSLCRLLKP